MDKEHKSVDAYYKHVSIKANQADHRGFLNARKEWVRQHNEGGPDRKRLKSKKELQEARKQLDVVKKLGGKFLAPKKQFILEEDWDETEHGPFDPSKVVTENIMGKDQKGIWRLKGKKGVFDYEEYQDAAVEERENIHDSKEDGPFSEEALARKRKAVMEQVAEGSRARDKVAVDAAGSELSMQDLLNQLKQAGCAPGPAREAAATGQVEEDSASASESESGSKSSSEERGGGESNLFGPVKKKQSTAEPKTSAKAKATSNQGSGQTQPAKKRVAAKTESSQKSIPTASTLGERLRQTKEKTSKEKGAQVQKPGKGDDSILLADGRAARAFKNLKDKLDEWSAAVKNIAIEDEPPLPDAQSQSAFKQLCAKRAADLKTLGRNCRDYQKRMDKSTNKEAFAEPLAKLENLENACQAFSNFFAVAPQSSLQPEAYVKAFEACESGLPCFEPQSMGAAFAVKYCMAKASLNCLYGDYKKFCEEFSLKSDTMQSLSQNMGRQKLEALVVPEVEGRILLTLRALKAEDVNALATGQVTTNISEFISLADALISASQAAHGLFLAESLKDSCVLARNLLSRDDVAATAASVETCEKEKTSGDDGLHAGAVTSFFLEHALGKSVVDLAAGYVKAGEKQGAVQKSLQELATGLEGLQLPNSSQGVKLIEALQPLQALVDRCAKEVSGLKAAKGDPDISNVKLASKAWEKCNEIFAQQKDAYCQQVEAALRTEIKVNLAEQLQLGNKSNILVLILALQYRKLAGLRTLSCLIVRNCIGPNNGHGAAFSN